MRLRVPPPRATARLRRGCRSATQHTAVVVRALLVAVAVRVPVCRRALVVNGFNRPHRLFQVVRPLRVEGPHVENELEVHLWR